jgi:hypothetical protein
MNCVKIRGMETYLQKHLASILAALITAGVIGAIGITFQNRMDNELTRQRIGQIDSMVSEVGRRVEKIQDIVQADVVRQKVAIIEIRIDELEKKVTKQEAKVKNL